jgi:hypothetical protein
MATDKQIAANRRNAQLSTGPRSAEGKARSSRNALKTGLYCPGIIIGHESTFKLEELERQFTAEYQPATPTERSLVDSLIHYEWLLRRYRWLETETWRASTSMLSRDQMETTWTGHAFILNPAISRIHRLRNSTQRAFRETLAELRTLQAERLAQPEPESQAIENKHETEELASFRQIDEFEPSSSLPVPPAHPKYPIQHLSPLY